MTEGDMAAPAGGILATEVRRVGGWRALRSRIAMLILAYGGGYSGVPERLVIVRKSDGTEVAEDGIYNSYAATGRKAELDKELSVKPLAEFLHDHEIPRLRLTAMESPAGRHPRRPR